jgi:hypothetical protein
VTRDDRRETKAVTDYAPDPSSVSTHGDVVQSLVYSCGVVGRDAYAVSTEFAEPYERASSKQERSEVLLSVVQRCADAQHPFAYLSVPLTTGRAYIELRARTARTGEDHAGEFQTERKRTVEQNRKRAHEAAKRLRANVHGMVIDPSRMIDVPGWEQRDYHAFWINVIDRFAEEVFFLDGWQYSVGCTIEFSTAVKLGLPTLTTEFTTLDPAMGQQLVHAALQEYAEIGLDPNPLREALSIGSADNTPHSRSNGD